MSEHSKEAVEAYPDRFVTVFAGEALDPAVLAERTAFDRGFAAGKATRLEGDREKVLSVATEFWPTTPAQMVDALFASGIIRQSTPTETGSTVGGDEDE